MKILVTGGLGFIGSNFIRRMLQVRDDVHITNFDAITYAGNPDNLTKIEKDPRYTFVKGNICDRELVRKIVQNHDIIVNFAAETHVDRSIFDPQIFVKTDIIGTYTLLEAARDFGIKKFVQISSDEVYGSINEGKFSEEDMLEPSSPYSSSKAGADLIALSFSKTFKVPVVITRTCNNLGPNQHPEKFIPLFITNLLEGKKVPIYGDGLNIREWIYVDDNCDAIIFLLERGVPGEIYNIGTDEESTNIDIAKFLVKELGLNDSYIKRVRDRPAHDHRYSVNSQKIRSLGWTHKHDLKSSLKKTISWYKTNTAWWKKTKSGEYKEYYKKQYGEEK